MKIDNNIVNILGGGYSVSEVKFMDQTVWKYTPPFDDVIGGPGNRKLLKGTMEAGWFGEVPASDFITGDELARLIGLNAGTSQYSDEPWLKFGYEGEIYFWAKKPFRYGLSHDQLNAVNAVYGDRVETIRGKKYAIMLPRGTGKDVQSDPKRMIRGYDGVVNHNSMWNKLMLPIHKNAPSNWGDSSNVKSPTENWGVGYTDADLITHYNNGNGSLNWCQETVYNTSYRLYRGYRGVAYSRWNNLNNTGSYSGWRPVLKLIG